MATLYTKKDKNIRKTYGLFVGFFIVTIAIGWTFSYVYESPGILVFAVIFSVAMSLISYWQSDKIVLSMAHAVPVTKEEKPELYRIVENLAITAGLPLPKIYIIPEAAPNAFATGRDPEHSVVAVTSGLLQKLDKVELEGVIAHELSHIGNRDMLVSTVAVVLVGFISLAADWFLRSTFWHGFGGRERDENGQAGTVMMLIGIVLSILALIAATLMQLALSRKREFLADASGALLTRYPEGLASALEKIAADNTKMRFANNTTAHLWLESPFREKEGKVSLLSKLFMTHPPVEERVKALREME